MIPIRNFTFLILNRIYLKITRKVPWENLRYLFGDIMYGGHITDDWDRRLCRTYLEEFMNPLMLDGELQLAPGFTTPPSYDYIGYHAYIDDNMPTESPYLYGLHPNAEIDFLSTKSDYLFKIVLELQPREVSSGSEIDGLQTKEEIVKTILLKRLISIENDCLNKYIFDR